MGKTIKIRIRDQHPESYFRGLRNNFLGSKLLKLFDVDPDPESGIFLTLYPGWKNSDLGYGYTSRGSATLGSKVGSEINPYGSTTPHDPYVLLMLESCLVSRGSSPRMAAKRRSGRVTKQEVKYFKEESSDEDEEEVKITK
jgi:hypothetical protein